MSMRYLPVGYNVKELEQGAKNKWRWEWLHEKDSTGGELGDWLRKVESCGKAVCEVCKKTLHYQSSGKKAFRLHAEDPKHRKNARTIKTNLVLPGSSKATPAVESMPDRVAKQRVHVSAFLSEHCLPFSLAGDILELSKCLAKDKPALERVTLSPTSVTYINTHGLAKSFKEELKSKMKNRFVSLNLDEATNKNNDKVLNILVQYFDVENNKVAIDHLGSRIQNVATAPEIVKSIGSVLDEYDLKWSQIVSVLMDNCSTMRGVKKGVEPLIREKNNHLLDISGDTVHMMSNVAKALMTNIDVDVQSICSDIYYDVEESPKVKEILHDIMGMMNSETTKQIMRPISSRFLQMQDVTTRLIEVLDYVTVYYAAFLTPEEKNKYSDLLGQIFQRHKVSDEAKAAITLVQMAQEQQQKSKTSQDRKDRIIDAIFTRRTETITMLNLCRGLLAVFQGYVKKFQKETAQIHNLHEQMVDVTKEFLSLFIKPENIPDRVTHLVQLDVTDRSLQKLDKDLAVGKYAQSMVTKARIDKSQQHWLKHLFQNLRRGFECAAKKLLQLPLANKTLRNLQVLDPSLHGHSQASTAFKFLASKLPNVVTPEEEGQLNMELNAFSVDRQVKDLSDAYDEQKKVDTDFWAKVFCLKTFNEQRYPTLSKLAQSLLSIFSGPLVEGTFNIMGDIIEEDRAKICIENYEAVAIVKTAMKRSNVKASTLKVTTAMKRNCIRAYSNYQKFLKQKQVDIEDKKKMKLSESIGKLKLEKAKRLAKLTRLKNRLVNKVARQKETRKRAVEGSNSKLPSTSNKWKRIKTI